MYLTLDSENWLLVFSFRFYKWNFNYFTHSKALVGKLSLFPPFLRANRPRKRWWPHSSCRLQSWNWNLPLFIPNQPFKSHGIFFLPDVLRGKKLMMINYFFKNYFLCTYYVPFRLRELQQGGWQITRGDQQVGLKMTPRNLGRSPPPTFTSLGHILTLLPQTMALCYMVGFRYIYKSGVDFSGTQGLGLPTLPFTISLYPFTLQVRGLWLFLNTPSPRSSVSLFTLFLLVRRAQCSTSNYWNLHIFSRMLSLLLCL